MDQAALAAWSGGLMGFAQADAQVLQLRPA
jgi:hypothetical protein